MAPKRIALYSKFKSSIIHVIMPKIGKIGTHLIFKGILKDLSVSGDVYLRIIAEAFIKIKLAKSV